MLNPIVNTIAITNGLIGIYAGTFVLIPSAIMANSHYVKPGMILIGLSGLSIIPVTVVATTMSLVTDDLGYQSLYMIPTVGIGIGIITDGVINSFENLVNPPVVEQPIMPLNLPSE